MISIKSPEEIKIMREGGVVLRSVAQVVSDQAKEGVSLRSLDELAKQEMLKAGGRPAFLNYRPAGANKPYPASICASVNEVIVHGLPTEYLLKNGDLLKIDFGLIYKDFYTDIALTVGIGNISKTASQLISVTHQALDLAIKQCQIGKNLGDIGFVINKFVRQNSFSVARGLTGHGIGRHLHEDPSVFNEGQPGRGMKLIPGLVIAIEPMISAGGAEIIQLPDESYATKDGSLSAHFEDTVAITAEGPLILTRF